MTLLKEKVPSLYGSVSEVFTSDVKLTNIPVLCAAFCAALATGGPTYSFGLYGSTLKATLHLSQSQLDTLSSASFCAGMLSWIPGLCVDRWGPRTAMGLGGIVMSCALLAYWLVATEVVVVPHSVIVPVLCTLGVLVFMSNSLVIGSLFKGIVVGCGRGTRGSAVGAAKGYVGLGAGVYSILFDAIRRNEESELDFLIMSAVLAVLGIVLPAFTMMPPKNSTVEDVSTPWHYRSIYVGLFLLMLLVLYTGAAFMFRPRSATMNDVVHIDLREDNVDEPHILKAIFILLAWIGPITFLFVLPRRQELTYDAAPTLDEEEASGSAIENKRIAEHHLVTDLNLTQMIRTIPCWLFLWTCTIVVGSGTMMTNNMGQMVEARGFSKPAASASLALFSVAQSVARVLTGVVSERALLWGKGVPRPVFVILTSFVALIGHATLAAATTRSVFVLGVIMAGTAFGMIWPLMVLIVGDLFGTANHGANYMLYDGFTSAIGTLIVSKLIVQDVYESHIDLAIDEFTCYGIDCFRQSQAIVAVLCGSCLISSALMTWMTRDNYRRSTNE